MDILKMSSSWFSHMKHEKKVWSDVAAQINCGQVVPSSFSLIFTGSVCVCVCAFYGTRLFPTCQVGVSIDCLRRVQLLLLLSSSLLLLLPARRDRVHQYVPMDSKCQMCQKLIASSIRSWARMDPSPIARAWCSYACVDSNTCQKDP